MDVKKVDPVFSGQKRTNPLSVNGGVKVGQWGGAKVGQFGVRALGRVALN